MVSVSSCYYSNYSKKYFYLTKKKKNENIQNNIKYCTKSKLWYSLVNIGK